MYFLALLPYTSYNSSRSKVIVKQWIQYASRSEEEEVTKLLIQRQSNRRAADNDESDKSANPIIAMSGSPGTLHSRFMSLCLYFY